MSGIAHLKNIALDSNLFIYHFEGNPAFTPFTDKIFEKLIRGKLKAVTSMISLIEILSYPAPSQVIKDITDAFLGTPNLNIFDVNEHIAFEAARIRRKYRFRLPDAIQLATAKLNRADTFISNDARLKQFNDLKVMLLHQV